ncbi:DUF485 domain-containing protein [Microlunatus soli]|uniref:Uncharacterized membrane protein, DUF485 family n=1 Tax=Microlunatus soli TaxID=630515 RepID=A0A1H1SYJ8_9ACTN|nr:DUF485 domain-containing protein [Microlunatus soli]SDS52984.1 Uncharacterized membrane protein, DUF485 family [Microlunatus soli]
MSQPDTPEADRIDPAQHKAYAEIAASTEFQNLRKRFLSFAFPATVIFMIWYVVYVLCNNWARGFMDIQVFGNINIALIFGLLQFVSTFVIAILYARHANRSIDPAADKLRQQFEAQVQPKEDRS